ncbi:unnamed protein product (macronuclear) [Paramecium tetraurelia]|uniref:START domain-containing protein n=1 Tax=Paramecium tetraurelia TaxID=5888 RepID=A0DUE1_PARTE|nr:uncharacterized protein GSPATT00020330001 [Paramecium tetraurelia]CAK86658.1 unnamed protein product [Paramecium tetraurelia]|eukprot:XP_001454055.1 hypothetical protein (macronuclear) [Paramecium tetraurelia strain d4-2]
MSNPNKIDSIAANGFQCNFFNNLTYEEMKSDLQKFVCFIKYLLQMLLIHEQYENGEDFYKAYEIYVIGREKLVCIQGFNEEQLTDLINYLETNEKMIKFCDFYRDCKYFEYFPPHPQQVKNFQTQKEREIRNKQELLTLQILNSQTNIVSSAQETNIQQFENQQILSDIQFVPSFQELYNIVLNYDNDSKLDKAYQTIQLIDRTQLSQDQIIKLSVIENSYEFMMKNLAELDSNGWTLDKKSHGISISYKFPPKSSSVSLLMEAEIEADCAKLMSLITEVELFSQYVPFCNHAATLKTLSKTQKVCLSQLYFPVISNRETIFLGQGIDRLEENGTIVFLCKSIDQDQQFLDYYNLQLNKSKNVRLQLNYYIFQITPINKTRCKIKAVNNSNPQLSFVPTWLVALIARKFAFQLVEKIVKYTKNFEKYPWYKKTQENPEFYQWLQNKIDNYFA